MLREPVPLEELVRSRTDVVALALGGITAYSTNVEVRPSYECDPIAKPFIAALADPHTLVWAESSADVQYMIEAIQSRKKSVPGEFAKLLSGIGADVPLLVLRIYDPTNVRDLYSPLGPCAGDLRVQVASGALALFSAAGADLHVELRTQDPIRAVRFVQKALLPEECYGWDVHYTDTGFTARVSPVPEEARRLTGQGGVLLMMRLFFGMNILI